jgi:mRNA interferase HigB
MRDYARRHPAARVALTAWVQIVRQANWQSIRDVRHVFPNADAVMVKSERTATMFNICGNNYRLIVAIHYNRQLVFVLRFLTHAEYDRDTWKETL